jgi:hypothetical protein
MQTFPNVAPAGQRLIVERLGHLEPFFRNPAHVQVEAAGCLLPQGRMLAGKPPGNCLQGAQVLTQVPRSARLEALTHKRVLRCLGRLQQRSARPRLLLVDERFPFRRSVVVKH